MFEMVRVYGDRITMQWEDDRMHLLQNIWKETKIREKQARTISTIQREFTEFKQSLFGCSHSRKQILLRKESDPLDRMHQEEVSRSQNW